MHRARVHAVHFVGVAFVGKKRRMQIAVAHVAERSDLQVEYAAAVSAMNPTIVASSVLGTVTSSRIVVGRRRASAAKALRRAEASCSASASSRAAADVARAVLDRDRLHPRGLVGDHRWMPVGFHQQDGLAIGRQPDVRVVLDADRGHPIEKLERAGNDARGDDRRHRLGRILDPTRRAPASSAARPDGARASAAPR